MLNMSLKFFLHTKEFYINLNEFHYLLVFNKFNYDKNKILLRNNMCKKGLIDITRFHRIDENIYKSLCN